MATKPACKRRFLGAQLGHEFLVALSVAPARLQASRRPRPRCDKPADSRINTSSKAAWFSKNSRTAGRAGAARRRRRRWSKANGPSSCPTPRPRPPAKLPSGGVPLGWQAPANVNRWWCARSSRRYKYLGRCGPPNRSAICESARRDEARGRGHPAGVRNRGVSARIFAGRIRPGSRRRA